MSDGEGCSFWVGRVVFVKKRFSSGFLTLISSLTHTLSSRSPPLYLVYGSGIPLWIPPALIGLVSSLGSIVMSRGFVHIAVRRHLNQPSRMISHVKKNKLLEKIRVSSGTEPERILVERKDAPAAGRREMD